MTMRSSLLVASAVLAFATTAAWAAPQTKPLSTSQQHMSDCSHQAAGKKGDDYKSSVSACLKGENTAAATAKQTPQQRMKSCNADPHAKTLKGTDRQTFMSNCLKATH